MRAPLVKQAVVGSGRTQPAEPSGWPTDQLIEDTDANPERQLLLQAGIEATYLAAGRRPIDASSIGEQPAPAEPESAPYCSPGFAGRLQKILSHQRLEDLIPEAIGLLTQSRQIVPPAALPAILSRRDSRTRQLAGPAIGARGRWLARFHRQWRWAADAAGIIDKDADLEQLWQEGSAAQRQQALERQRTLDPAKARDWLSDVFGQEKAPVREKLLAALTEGLSDADEEFLESVVAGDRSANVRAVATELLVRLPSSRLVTRMLDRTKQMLALESGVLNAEIPATFQSEWEKDGLNPKPPIKLGNKSWWLAQLLGASPPSVWERYFQSSPQELIVAAVRGDWTEAILLGWSTAIRRNPQTSWIEPLYVYWLEYSSGRRPNTQLAAMALTELEASLASLPSERLDQLIVQLFESCPTGEEGLIVQLRSLLSSQPQWSEPTSRYYINRLYATVRTVFNAPRKTPDATTSLLHEAAVRLSPRCFPDALRPFEIGEAVRPHQRQLEHDLSHFHEVVWLRKQLHEEIRRGEQASNEQ